MLVDNTCLSTPPILLAGLSLNRALGDNTDCHSYEKCGLHYIVWVLLAPCRLLSWYCHVSRMNRWDKVVPFSATNAWDFLKDFTNTAVMNTAINHQQSGFHMHRWACVHCTNTYLQSKRYSVFCQAIARGPVITSSLSLCRYLPALSYAQHSQDSGHSQVE